MSKAFDGDLPVTMTVQQRYADVYDAIVLAFDHMKIPLDAELLQTTIPAVVFDNAVLSEWIPDPIHTIPSNPVSIGKYTIEDRDAERFMNLLNHQICFWLDELQSDKDHVWEMRRALLNPSAVDLSKETPTTLLYEYRARHGDQSWLRLAKAAARLSMGTDYEAFLALIYRIEKGTNVSSKRLECLAAAMSTPTRKVEWRDLRWPKQRQRPRRKSTNRKE